MRFRTHHIKTAAGTDRARLQQHTRRGRYGVADVVASGADAPKTRPHQRGRGGRQTASTRDTLLRQIPPSDIPPLRLEVLVTADRAGLPSTGWPGPRDYAAASKARNTWRAYRSDWAQWTAWCTAQGLDPWQAQPEHVVAWVSELATAYRPSSIGRKVATLASVFKMAGRQPPTRDDRVRIVLAGIRRAHAGPTKQAAPLTGDLLRQLVAALDRERVADVRDGALLLGFAAALRRSELVALDVTDLEFVAGGVRVTVRRSKVDQEGHGAVVGVPNGERPDTCPVRWLQRWLAVSGIEGGPVWRMVDAWGHVRDGRRRAQRRSGLLDAYQHAERGLLSRHAQGRRRHRGSPNVGTASRLYDGRCICAGGRSSPHQCARRR